MILIWIAGFIALCKYFGGAKVLTWWLAGIPVTWIIGKIGLKPVHAILYGIFYKPLVSTFTGGAGDRAMLSLLNSIGIDASRFPSDSTFGRMYVREANRQAEYRARSAGAAVNRDN